MRELVAPVRPPINYGTRAKLGMMFPSVNVVAEPQMTAMLPPGVSLHTTRLHLDEKDMRTMLDRLEEATTLLADARVDRILFHCTGVTMSSVEIVDEIRQRIAAITDTPAVITSDAVLQALACFGATKVVLLTPYKQAINDFEVRFLTHHGITVLRERGLNLDGPKFATVEPEQWFAEAVALRDSAADAYFLSCTAIRSTDVVEALERELGRPVVTSNQAAMWRALRDAGIDDRIEGFGRLFREF